MPSPGLQAGCPTRAAPRAWRSSIYGSMIGMRYPVQAHAVGDAEENLKLLNPTPRRKEDRCGGKGIEKNVRTCTRIMADRAAGSSTSPGGPAGGGQWSCRRGSRTGANPDHEHILGTGDELGGRGMWRSCSTACRYIEPSARWPRWGRACPTPFVALFAYLDRPVIAFEGRRRLPDQRHEPDHRPSSGTWMRAGREGCRSSPP